MKFLVTGGAGFIGSHLVDRLALRGDSVVVLDDFNDYYDPKHKRKNIAHHAESDAVSVVEGDITDPELLNTLFEQHHFDGILHIAARAGVRPSIADPLLYQHVNVYGTYLLFETARKHGVKHIVCSSSSSVYGESSQAPFSEDEQVGTPISPYAATKKALEEIAYTYHHLFDMNIVCLRYFTVYGERGRPDMAPWIFTERILRGETIPQFGDGTSERDYTYVSDIVDGTIAALDRADALGYAIINLGNGNPIALKDFIAKIERVSGKTAKIEQLPEQPGDVKRTHANVTKAKTLLGYEPRVSFEEGLKRFVDWYRQTFNIK